VHGGDYTVDPIHSSVTFKVEHMGISWVHGRFNQVQGKFTFDGSDPESASFDVSIPVASIDTNNSKRDLHLKNADFFNVSEYPDIKFKSTAVKRRDNGYEVTGDFTMHGVTKPITFTLRGGKEIQFMTGGAKQIGFTTELSLKRSEFGMDKMVGPIGDLVQIAIGLEATRK
jgi:polyisoprenoid-binding protein YceI